MTNEQQRYAEEAVNRIKAALTDDENLDHVSYHDGEYSDELYFDMFLKQAPQYKYIGIPIKIKNLSSVDVDLFVDSWRRHTTPEDIESFIHFIKAGEKYGWD